MSSALVVSLHDVSPRTYIACRQIVQELEEIGIRRCSLLVIPDHHYGGHFLDDPGLCEWLQEKAQAGHEVVIHGYHHRRTRGSDESLITRITTRFYTADEGEFYDIGHAASRKLLLRAMEDFAKLGFHPKGFIAPAWLLSKEAEATLCELGFRYTTRLGGVLDLQTGRYSDSQSMVWSVRSGWRRQTSLIWNSLLYLAQRSNPLLRISIHPVDYAYDAIWRQIRDSLARVLSSREPFTYDTWIAQQRALVNA